MKLIKSRVALYTFTLLALACAGCKQEPPAASQSPSPAATNTPPQPVTQTSETQPSAANASSPVKGKIDACKLITGEEIQSVQRDTLKETKASEQSSGGFATAQCFYLTNNFVNSISLTVTQKDPANAGGPSIRDFWKERFGSAGREKERENERDKDAKRGEEEESRPPQTVKSLGDEAYWVGNQKVGALYVLTGDKFLRISIGGADSQKVKTEKMKTLARKVIKRL